MKARHFVLPAFVSLLFAAGIPFVSKTSPRNDSPGASPRGLGPLLAEARERAEEEWRLLPRLGPASGMPLADTAGPLANLGSVSGQVWKPIGPNPIVEQGCCGSTIIFQANGRVNSIAVHPSDPDVLFLGSAGGGVWRSDDGGATWRPLTDSEPSLGIGSSHAIAIDPAHPQTIYAGTSNFALLAQSQPRPFDLSQSKGILKSTDGGLSWIVLGSGFPAGNDGNALQTFSQTDINTLIVDPAASTTLYAAAGRSVRGGLYLSTDGAANWTLTGQANQFVESLVLDTSSPLAQRVLYAGVRGIGVLRSGNGGQSWTSVLDATTVASALPTGFGKVMVALAPTSSPPNSAGQVVYVTLLDPNGQAALFENTNGGDSGSWVQKNAVVTVFSNSGLSTLSGSQFSDMVVDPASPGDGVNDLIYWGGFSQYLSTDSGNTFAEIGQIHGTHGDHQTFLVVPQSGGPSVVYAGDDGGIWKSTDQGTSWTGTSLSGSPPTINAGGLQIATLYALTVKQDATASVSIGGAQDSGILRTTGSLQWTGTSNDGIDVVFDRVATGTAYSIQNCDTGDCIFKSTDSGGSWADITGTIPQSQRAIFRNRLAVDPSNAGYLYVGGSAGAVFQSMDFGGSWRSLGTVLAGRYVSSLDVAPADSNRLIVAANDPGDPASAVTRRVSVTTNALDANLANITFDDITGDLPSRFVTAVAFDPNDANMVYATLAGYGAETPGHPGHVFRADLTDSNLQWTDVSPPVDLPVNTIVLDGTSSPAMTFVGTDLGVLVSGDGGASWSVVDDLHLPNAAVSRLALNTQAGVLRAGTWGRGVFELADPSGPVIALGGPATLHFGDVCGGSPASDSFDVHNVGTQDLHISSVSRLFGSPTFTVAPTPATPLTLGAGSQANFQVLFSPTTPGELESASIRVSSDDPGAPFVDLLAAGALESEPPEIFCPAPITAECTGPSGAVVSFAATATDNCAVASVSCPLSGSTFPLGTSPVSCSATDTATNTSQCSSTVTVADTTPPVISEVSATPNLLWPPNHGLVPVELTVSVTDVCDPNVAASCHIASIASDEPVQGTGSGDSSPDWEITGSLAANLRAERSGGGDGRAYTLTVTCSDGSGNSAAKTVAVVVPHDQKKK